MTFSAYTGDGVTTQFDITFAYRLASTVKATVDGVEATFTFINDSRIEFDEAPANGSEIKIYRETPLVPAEVTFADGAILTDDDLNNSVAQSRDATEEVRSDLDALNNASLRAPIGETLNTLPPANERAGLFNGWDENGQPALLQGSDGTGGALALALAASDGAGMIGVGETTLDEMLSTVTPLQYGAVGDGVTDDTAACQAAIDTGKNVKFPEGYVFAVTTLTNFADYRRYSGGGAIKKIGAASPICDLPYGSKGVWFDGLEIDGDRDSYSIGEAGAGIFAVLSESLRVTDCYIHDVVDSGIKLRDSSRATMTGNRIVDGNENGIEIRNYDVDPTTGVEYVLPRPDLLGGHIVSHNHIERITRYENPEGPLVDACGVTMDSSVAFAGTPKPLKNVKVVNNTFVDCLRAIFTENNQTGTEIDGLLIANNDIRSSVSGGTAENIYSKVGIGVIAAHNVIIVGNTIINPVNHNPDGTETAGILVSASWGQTTSKKIRIAGNTVIDTTGDPDRMEYGIYLYVGEEIEAFDNTVSGAAIQNIYADPNYVTDLKVGGNNGADDDQSWSQLVPYMFSRSGIPAAAATYDVWAHGTENVDVAIAPAPGRIVAMTARTNAVPGTNFNFKAFVSPGLHQAGVELDQTIFGGGASGTRRVSSFYGDQFAGGDQIWVKFTNDGTGPASLDAAVTVWVDHSVKQ